MENISKVTRKLAVMGMMLAIISVLSIVEHMLPPIPFLPPNVKLGLSNIITMYVLFFMGKKSAILLAVIKSAFVVLMRGVLAGALSLCGGFMSIFAIMLVMFLTRNKASYIILSVTGAIFHNLGQITAASFIMSTNLVPIYMPVLLVFGVIMGVATGSLLVVVMPMFDRIIGRG